MLLSSTPPGYLTRSIAILSIAFASAAAYAEGSIYGEQYKLIRAPNAVISLDQGLFGDKINLYSGTLEFVQTDVSLPGNNKLPVAIGRRLVTGNYGLSVPKQFGTWELEIPHIHGVFSASKGWVDLSSTNQRCTNYGLPPSVSGSGTSSWAAGEYWHGNFMYVPGAGDQEILRSTSPSLSPAALITRDLWTFTCNNLQSVNTNSRDNGQGFTAVSPDGTSYRFDWLATRVQDPIEKDTSAPQGLVAEGGPSGATVDAQQGIGPAPQISGSNILQRREVWIMPTQVTDRFGNWVRYTYDTTDLWKVTRIESSDGRVITLQYGNAGTQQITSVSDGTRTWNYSYSGGALDVVTLPDNSTWQLGGATALLMDLNYAAGSTDGCDNAGYFASSPLTASMVHPSGATGTFTLTPTHHGRSYVTNDCRLNIYSLPAYAYYPRVFDTFSLTTKALTGPGLPSGGLVWTYAYGAPNASWADCSGCTDVKSVMMTAPDNFVTRYTFGNRFRATEGLLLREESGLPQYTGETGGTPLRTTNMHYQVFPTAVGDSLQPRGDGEFNSKMMPVDQRQTTQQGSTFTWAASSFSPYGKPVDVSRSSGLNPGRNETTVYYDNPAKWVLGQVQTVTETTTGKVIVENTYNSTTANLESVKKFGLLQQSMTYNADGTLATRSDGLNNTITFTNYKRGIAQNVLYPDGATESAVVDNIGNIASLTDATNATTTFGYTAGRLSYIGYPSPDTVAWNPTLIYFTFVNSTEWDIPAGHWRQDIWTGNALTMQYYDALLRPVWTYTLDQKTSDTDRLVKRSFDFAGRTTFETYPKRYAAFNGEGVGTTYDALGRVIQTTANSELGTINTFTNYLTNFQKSTTDPRGNTTVTSFQAFDEPSESAISNIAAPLGVNVAIARDVFGKATSVTRSGGGKSATRSYVYDSYPNGERLCKTIEPETGATVQALDAANNVTWRASGLALPSNSCDTASVAANKKVSFGYDKMNRLTSTTYSDGSPSITRTYTADGLPNTIVSNGATWTNTYNNRRKNERESLVYGGTTYNIDRSYDVNGSLLRLTYPDSTTVNYNPNALGEPTQVGIYARSINFHPNGAVASFTYGNGLTHSMSPNVRGLPTQSTDGGVLNDAYTYDESANVTGITDSLAPSVSSRSMTYDALDRLQTVNASNLWGSATYGYDALDNLTSTTITGGGTARSTLHNFDPTTNRLTSTTNGPAAYNFSYGYDSQGNITQRGSQTYVFDQGNRMSSATGKATYGYDGLGHRFTVVGTDGVNRVQVYSQDGQLLYVRNTAQPLATGTKYIYLNRHQIAEVKAAGAN